jgi:hypothetical protein
MIFFPEVCDAAKLAIIHRKVHSKIGDHPWEGLAKPGYKPDMECKSVIILP